MKYEYNTTIGFEEDALENVVWKYRPSYLCINVFSEVRLHDPVEAKAVILRTYIAG